MSKIIDKEKARLDAFGRARMATPLTLFDSKLLGDNRPILWDDQEVSGGGTGSAYDATTTSVKLSVTSATAGTRVRQTFQRFNYQPGKSMAVFMTGVMGAGQTGVIKRIGYFDDNDGLFFEMNGTTLYTVIRNNGTDTRRAQAGWSVTYPFTNRYTGATEGFEFLQKVKDPLDGTGPSGINLDMTKTQIFIFDFEWLGVGSVRFGIVIDGYFYYINESLHANLLTDVYMRTPNLPLRYEISSDGNNEQSDNLKAICGTVISEGGQEATGVTRYISTAGTQVDANSADTTYAVLGIRLKSTHLDNIVKITDISIINESAGSFEWAILLNPSVADPFIYSDITDSAIQAAQGSTATTVTGGYYMSGGYVSSGTRGGGLVSALNNLRYLGASIAGVPDELVLVVTPLGVNQDIQASITYTENA